jgi:tetratricopeptide (TPR) repeat protein
MRIIILRFFVASLWVSGGLSPAQESGVPPAEIEKLKTSMAAQKTATSEARKRLAVKRTIRDGGKLLEAHSNAENRFEVLGILFQAQKQLFSLDDSSRNREALLETCKALIKAPDRYADLRLDADLLLTQIEAARKGADSAERLAALLPLVTRYRDTPAEGRMLRTALVMALETGDPKMIKFLRNEMAVRFAGDIEMIEFQREKLGGQVFGAPFRGLFKRSDGTYIRFPADVLGKTTVLYFWSKKDTSDDHVQRLAEEWNKQKAEVSDRLQIVSFNLDELPDAGEKILRDLGVEWPALHLPGGRDNPFYKTFPRRDPYMMTLSPTGYAALIMAGSTRRKVTDTGKTDFSRWFQSSLARDWSRERYTAQLNSLFAGDFFITDPEGEFDPALPPEVKALSATPTPLERSANSVPDEVLRAIQECFVKPPVRYRLSSSEIRANYQKAEELCAKAIESHPDAPDLWIVRNRRIVAQLGLWKLTNQHPHFESALQETRISLQAGFTPGTEGIVRYCLAKEAMRKPDANVEEIVKGFRKSLGEKEASAPTLAAGALLALDIANRGLHDEFRDAILKNHLNTPMMWTFNSWLLNREHRYWLFRVPFVAGWSYGRQHQWILSQGKPDEVSREVSGELQTFDGESFHIPEDSKGKWTIILFTNSWVDDPKSPLPSTVTRYLNPFIEKRGPDDVQVIVAVIDGEVGPIQAYLKEKPFNCEILMVPAGTNHPLVQQLGILDEDTGANALVLRPDGKVASFVSGLTLSRSKAEIINNLIIQQDEQTVIDLLAKGEAEKAKELIFKLAPPFDPEAVDEKGRKLKKPVHNYIHLRARARVYQALGDQAAALTDAEEVLKFLTTKGGWMSMRPEGLDEAEDYVKALKGGK